VYVGIVCYVKLVSSYFQFSALQPSPQLWRCVISHCSIFKFCTWNCNKAIAYFVCPQRLLAHRTSRFG